MTSRTIHVPPFALTVFGATGDLAMRKLMPALYHRDLAGQIPDEARIVGASRPEMDSDTYRAQVEAALRRHVGPAELIETDIARFLGRLSYRHIDGTGEEGWPALATHLRDNTDMVKVHYLATAPSLFAPICQRLGAHGLSNHGTRLVVEKPVGTDLASSVKLNDAIGAVFPEPSVFRIDHYLGKETVQNLMALRFANTLFEPLWNAAHIDHVQITVAETLGLGSRAGYYDKAGALRDMVQNHLLQLLCLVAMEPPTMMDADAVRDEKLKVLRSLVPITEDEIGDCTVRGQYLAGASSGGAVPGYLEELGNNASRTETFVALKAEVANWRWAGVPFYLRTGKRLPLRVSEIVVQFRSIPHSVFEKQAGPIRSNRLVIRLQPDEGMNLWLMIKDPGPGGMRLAHVPLDMSFADAFGVRNPDAYERLLMDVVRGNQTLFMRRDEVEAAWRWVDPIRQAWDATQDKPRGYVSGTWGPSAAVALIERSGRSWNDSL